MADPAARIRWQDPDSPGNHPFIGHLAGLEDVFRIHPPEEPGDDEWVLTTWLPGLTERQLFGVLDNLKLEAEHWLEEFVTSLGAVFPAGPDDDLFGDDEDGEPLEVKYAAGRRVRYAHPGAGYPGEAEHAAASLVIGEVYTIGWADIGQSRTDLNLYWNGQSVGRFNSVFFELADDEPPAKTATAGEEQPR